MHIWTVCHPHYQHYSSCQYYPYYHFYPFYHLASLSPLSPSLSVALFLASCSLISLPIFHIPLSLLLSHLSSYLSHSSLPPALSSLFLAFTLRSISLPPSLSLSLYLSPSLPPTAVQTQTSPWTISLDTVNTPRLKKQLHLTVHGTNSLTSETGQARFHQNVRHTDRPAFAQGWITTNVEQVKPHAVA